jgi:hypothetical protein
MIHPPNGRRSEQRFKPPFSVVRQPSEAKFQFKKTRFEQIKPINDGGQFLAAHDDVGHPSWGRFMGVAGVAMAA